jgi:ribose transport system ATP-binding protein
MPAPLLELSGITKSFGTTRALSEVEFDLLAGEVHALVGENGAGKSTLLGVLAGAVVPDAGWVVFNGKPGGRL